MTRHALKKPRYLSWSYGLLGLAVLFFIVFGFLLDSALTGVSLGIQRAIVLLTHVLPAALGVIAGWLAIRQTGGSKAAALLAIVLNALFALFFLAVLSFAG